MRFNAIKWEQEGAVTRKYDAAREKGGDNFKKSDFTHNAHCEGAECSAPRIKLKIRARYVAEVLKFENLLRRFTSPVALLFWTSLLKKSFLISNFYFSHLSSLFLLACSPQCMRFRPRRLTQSGLGCDSITYWWMQYGRKEPAPCSVYRPPVLGYPKQNNNSILDWIRIVSREGEALWGTDTCVIRTRRWYKNTRTRMSLR